MNTDQSSFPFGSCEHPADPTDQQRSEANKRWDAYPDLISFVSACRWAGIDMVDRLKADAKNLYRKHR